MVFMTTRRIVIPLYAFLLMPAWAYMPGGGNAPQCLL